MISDGHQNPTLFVIFVPLLYLYWTSRQFNVRYFRIYFLLLISVFCFLQVQAAKLSMP